MQLRDPAHVVTAATVNRITASIASCTYWPAQIIPGFTVPVVPLAPRSSAVDMANSTTGIIRLNGSRKPTSCTKACRYGRLYSMAKPLERMRLTLDADLALVADRCGARARRNTDADESGHRERTQELRLRLQIA